MVSSKRRRGPTAPRPGSRKSLIKLVNVLHQQAQRLNGSINNLNHVMLEHTAVIQLLLDKGVITRDEIKEKRDSLLHPHQTTGEGSSVQSKEAGPNVDSGGCSESGILRTESGRGNPSSNGGETERANGVPSQVKQSHTATPIG